MKWKISSLSISSLDTPHSLLFLWKNSPCPPSFLLPSLLQLPASPSSWEPLPGYARTRLICTLHLVEIKWKSTVGVFKNVSFSASGLWWSLRGERHFPFFLKGFSASEFTQGLGATSFAELWGDLVQINQSKWVNYHLHFQELVPSFPLSPQGQLITSNFGGLRFVKVVINDPLPPPPPSPPFLGSALECLVCFNIGGGVWCLHSWIT